MAYSSWPLWFQDQVDANRDQLVEFMVSMVVTTADITTALERELTEVASNQSPTLDERA